MRKLKIITFFIILFSSNTFAQFPNTISPEDKVYGLSMFWQEVNYNFVYFDKVDKVSWNNYYKELIKKVQNTKNDYEYYRELQKFCALLKDGHTNIYFPEYIENYISISEFGDYQIFISNIEDKAIITRTNASKKQEIPIGTEIIKVNDLDTKDYMNRFIMPFISSSTNHILNDWATMFLLESTYGTKYQLTLKLPNNKIKILNITSEPSTENEYYPVIEKKELLEFKWLKNKTAYIAINSFNSNRIKDLFLNVIPELEKETSLIIDLRYNGGGNSNNALDIVNFITNDSIIQLPKWSTRKNISAFKAWGKGISLKDTVNNDWAKTSYLAYKDSLFYEEQVSFHKVDKNSPKIVIPTAVLIGHNTASSAEDFLIYVNNQQHIIKIGNPTFGSTGMPMTLELPNGGEARICTKKDTYPNGEEFVGKGIQPDIFVEQTLNNFLKNKDMTLNVALEYLLKLKK